MGKIDLREFSDNELSMYVFNDEGLYRMRRIIRYRPEILEEYFIFTPEQLEVLKQDIEEDYEEERK